MTCQTTDARDPRARSRGARRVGALAPRSTVAEGRVRLQTATVLVAAPIALVFNLFLDRFIAGFTPGTVKG
jgi:hypothetical protein